MAKNQKTKKQKYINVRSSVLTGQSVLTLIHEQFR